MRIINKTNNERRRIKNRTEYINYKRKERRTEKGGMNRYKEKREEKN